MAKINNQSQTSKQGFDIPAIAKEVERVYGIYNQNIVRTVLEQAAAPELLETLQALLKAYVHQCHIHFTDFEAHEVWQKSMKVITKATGGTK